GGRRLPWLERVALAPGGGRGGPRGEGCAGRARVGVGGGVQHGPQHGGEQHPAVHRADRPVTRDDREPLVGPDGIPAVAFGRDRCRLVERGHAHSWPSRRSSASSRVPEYAPVDRHFQPASATMNAMSARCPALRALAAMARAACSAAPVEIPAKMPSASSSSRVRRRASLPETENRVVSTEGSYSSGTKPSSTLRSPYTSSPYRGSAATMATPGTRSRR